MPLNPAKLKAVQTLISKTGKRDEKSEIIRHFSGGRTASSRELTDKEAIALIATLQEQAPHPKKDNRAEKMRRKLISMAHELGWKLPTGKIDMKRINDWCVKYGSQHCKLNDYSYADLPALLTQFEKMYIEFIGRQ